MARALTRPDTIRFLLVGTFEINNLEDPKERIRTEMANITSHMNEQAVQSGYLQMVDG